MYIYIYIYIYNPYTYHISISLYTYCARDSRPRVAPARPQRLRQVAPGQRREALGDLGRQLVAEAARPADTGGGLAGVGGTLVPPCQGRGQAPRPVQGAGVLGDGPVRVRPQDPGELPQRGAHVSRQLLVVEEPDPRGQLPLMCIYIYIYV